MDRTARIADSFSRAAATYDTAAEVQRLAADHVVARALAHVHGRSDPRVLEVGCGTGYVSARLLAAVPGGTFLLTDLAQGMVDEARRRLGADPRTSFRAMDGEHPDLAPGQWDLVVASLATQWFTREDEGLRRLAGLLAPSGRLVVATLGQGALAEWRQAHLDEHLPCGTPTYPPPEWFQAAWPPTGRGRLAADVRQVVHYADGRAFLETLQTLGAATLMAGEARLGTGQLRRVLRALGNDCAITWRVLVLEFERAPE